MKWLFDLINARDSPRPLPETEKTSFEEESRKEEEEEETLGSVDADERDDRASLEFGKLRKGGETSLLGFCEVRQNERVEACEWKVAPLGPKQKAPAFKIRF